MIRAVPAWTWIGLLELIPKVCHTVAVAYIGNTPREAAVALDVLPIS